MRITKAIALLSVCMFIGGCTVRPFEDIKKTPFSITTVSSNYFNVMLQFNAIGDELSKTLKRSVRILCDWDVRSIKVHLRNRKDYYQLLYLSPVEFCQLNKDIPLTPIAMKKNLLGKTSEVGLIVVPKNSPIKKISDLKGKGFVFGPYGDAYRFYNVLMLFKASKFPVAELKDASYSEDDVSAVRRVLLGWADAAVVTETWWQTTSDKTLDLSKLLKDELRIIGKTKPVPEYVWAVTETVDAKVRDKVVKVLTKTISHKNNVLAGFKAKGFVPVEEKTLASYCKELQRVKNLPPKPGILQLR